MIQVSCSVALVNVCSIRDGEKGSNPVKGARAVRLDHQLHSAGIAVARVQETRMPQGQRTTTNYSVYASGHQQRSILELKFGLVDPYPLPTLLMVSQSFWAVKSQRSYTLIPDVSFCGLMELSASPLLLLMLRVWEFSSGGKT